ncbi:hypothetical protein [Nocardia paucivorans]|uniref:hypothetical protein n=1 Tax=Nocardia paucivorans TaxID=114259 RepID=UPI0012FAC29C|nr:hypothetical protein [Nocardia paucivorans]
MQLFEGLYRPADLHPSAAEVPASGFAFPATTEVGAAGNLRFAATTIDGRGRLAARSVIRALGWTVGLPLSTTVEGDVVTVRRSREGRPLQQHGFLFLAADIRNRCRLYAGDRVFLAASVDDELLVMYPPRALAAALWSYRPEVWRIRR